MQLFKKKQPVVDDEDIELQDVEGYRGEQISFDHQLDIARCLKRVTSIQSQEMRAGWFDFKRDKITGELLESKYHTDTREEYINSVNALMDVMIAEIEANSKVKENINKSIGDKENAYKKWADKEHAWWIKLPPRGKSVEDHQQGFLSNKQQFVSFCWQEKIELSREIFRELHRLLAELKYFKAVDSEN